MKILPFTFIIGFASAAFYSDGPCPVRPVIPKLDVKDLTGRWYEVSKFANAYDRGFECATTVFAPTGDKTFDVSRCERHNGVQHCDLYKAKQVVDEGIFLPEEINGRIKGEVKILYADFSEYMILYECRYLHINKTEDFLWVFSRTPILNVDSMKEAIKKIEEHFDIGSLQTVTHDEAHCGKRSEGVKITFAREGQ